MGSLPHTVAGPATYGCRPCHLRLQVGQSVAQSAAAAAHGGGAHGGAHTPLVAMATAASGRARARPPRILGPDATLQVYDQAQAALRDMLARVEAGAYRSESLRAIVALGAHSILFTEHRVLHVRAGTWEQAWMAPWARVYRQG